jgi:hypothetical protein
MTSKNTKWYSKKNISSGVYITDLKASEMEDVMIVDLPDEDIETLENIFSESMYNDRSRCISYYRDTIFFQDKIYNICLSCGDVTIDGERFMLTQNQNKELTILKEKFFSEKSADDFIAEKKKYLIEGRVDGFSGVGIWTEDVKNLMLEFANYHLDKFKKEISKKVGVNYAYNDGWDWTVDTDRINKLYPNENIF